MSEGMTIGDHLRLQKLEVAGIEPVYKEHPLDKSRREIREWHAAQDQKAIANANREARHAPVTGAYGEEGFKVLTAKAKGTTVSVMPEHTVDRETGELKAAEASTSKPKKMSNAEFHNNRDHCVKHAKDECTACVGFRGAARDYFKGGKIGKHPSREDHKCANR